MTGTNNFDQIFEKFYLSACFDLVQKDGRFAGELLGSIGFSGGA